MTLSSLAPKRNDNLYSHKTYKTDSLVVLLISCPKVGIVECSKAATLITECLRVIQRDSVEQWKAEVKWTGIHLYLNT